MASLVALSGNNQKSVGMVVWVRVRSGDEETKDRAVNHVYANKSITLMI